MKLDPNCIRDTLLAVEDYEFNAHITLNNLCEKLSQYNKDEIHYTCLKLYEGGFLDLQTLPAMMQNVPLIGSINGLTFQGHEFLEDIKEPSNWNNIISGCKKVGTFSLPFIKEIAIQVIKKKINGEF
ncbi:DUF2513 domain-containing protein [Clostridium sp. YIM B02555]|uniref:DUF2513 domain-containing protein n=1 Tax=Clostridium sp. YIM B02555 TaxID=2911968 RepID=UPI001EEDF45F|nr:DUF2513 domain-containing protein [Clostridium sp. YIM B02555]